MRPDTFTFQGELYYGPDKDHPIQKTYGFPLLKSAVDAFFPYHKQRDAFLKFCKLPEGKEDAFYKEVLKPSIVEEMSSIIPKEGVEKFLELAEEQMTFIMDDELIGENLTEEAIKQAFKFQKKDHGLTGKLKHQQKYLALEKRILAQQKRIENTLSSKAYSDKHIQTLEKPEAAMKAKAGLERQLGYLNKQLIEVMKAHEETYDRVAGQMDKMEGREAIEDIGQSLPGGIQFNARIIVDARKVEDEPPVLVHRKDE